MGQVALRWVVVEEGCHVVALLLGTFTPARVAAGDPALVIAGTAWELKCTSEEFLFTFRERRERPFQRFRFYEEKSAVVLFFLEVSEEAHLQSISRRVWGGGSGGRLHPGWRTLDGMGHTGARVAVGFGSAPSPLQMARTSGRQPTPLARTGVDRSNGCCIWNLIAGIQAYNGPPCRDILQTPTAWRANVWV